MKIAFFLPFTSFQFQFLSLVLVFFQKAHRDCFCCRLLPFLDVVAWDFAGKYINLYISDCVWIILMHLHKIFTQPAPRSAERAIENLRSCNKSCMICVYTIPRNLRQILCLSLLFVCMLLVIVQICWLDMYNNSTTTQEPREWARLDDDDEKLCVKKEKIHLRLLMINHREFFCLFFACTHTHDDGFTYVVRKVLSHLPENCWLSALTWLI